MLGHTNIMEKLGKFTVNHGLLISDPSYKHTDKYSQFQIYYPKEQVMTGEWNAMIEHDEDGCIKKLCAYIFKSTKCECIQDKLAVDSGQMGIFDVEYFRDDTLVSKDVKFKKPGDKWYTMCCDTTTTNLGASTIPFGVVSNSGYGDGVYDCFVMKKDNLVCGVEIVFIPDDDNSNEEYNSDDSYDDYVIEEIICNPTGMLMATVVIVGGIILHGLYNYLV